jgi:hypothetical protein
VLIDSETVRERPVFLEQQSARSADEIAGCLGRAWEKRSGQTAYYPTPSGFTMKLSYAVMSSQVLAVLVDVEDKGSARQITVRAQKGDQNEKLRAEVVSCGAG